MGAGGTQRSVAVALSGLGLMAFANLGCAMVFGLDELSVDDGQVDAGPGHEEVIWAHTFGGAQEEILWDLAIGPGDRIAMVGTTRGAASFGGEVLQGSGNGDEDVFVALLDKDGKHLWSRRFGDGSNQRPYGVALDKQGHVVVSGGFSGALDFGGSWSLKTAGKQDVFVAKLNGTSGATEWAYRFGDSTEQVGGRVVVTSDDEIVVMGAFFGQLDFGGKTSALDAAGQDIFVAKLASDGTPVWAKRLGDNSVQQPWDLAIDGQDDLLLTGELSGSPDFGGGPLAGGTSRKLFIVELSDGGDHLFSAVYGDEEHPQRGASIAAGAAGGAIVAGAYQGSLPLAGEPLSATGKSNAFVAAFDSSGVPTWASSYGDDALQQAYALASSTDGRLAVAGMSEGSVDFGAGPLVSKGGADLFVAVLSSNGDHVYSRMVGGSGKQEAATVGFTSTGDLVVGGLFFESLDWLATPQQSAGNADCFVVKLSAP